MSDSPQTTVDLSEKLAQFWEGRGSLIRSLRSIHALVENGRLSRVSNVLNLTKFLIRHRPLQRQFSLNTEIVRSFSIIAGCKIHETGFAEMKFGHTAH